MKEYVVRKGESPNGPDGSWSGRLVQADARTIFDHVLACVLPEPAVKRHVHLNETANTLTVADRTYNLRDYKRIVVVGGGKAGRRTGSALADILGTGSPPAS